MLPPTRLFILSAILILCASVGWCQPIPIGGDERPIGKSTEFYLDKKSALTLSDFLEDSAAYPFKKSTQNTLNFGPTSSACWIRFSYLAKDNHRKYLVINNTNINEVDVYVLSGKTVISRQEGGLAKTSRHSISNLNLNAWLFELPQIEGKVFTVYMRVTDKRRVIIPLEITKLNEVIRGTHQEDFLFGLYFGCLAIILVMNLYFFFYFKERIYIFYGGHILCQILINGILHGYLLTLFGTSLQFLSPYVPSLAGISNIFAILFALAFLDVKHSLSNWYKPTLLLIAIPASNVLFNLFGFYALAANTGTYVGIVVYVWLFALGLVAYEKKITQARFYIIGWGAFFITIVILNSALNQWLPINGFTFYAAVYGTLFEVLLISFALADRINLIRIGREEERMKHQALIERQKTWLEENVKMRTIQLVEKNREIEVQNEELRQQHEELTTTHELLEKQKTLIEEKSKDIVLINQSLEQKVKQRTLELEETVKNLINQNNDLEQFSYIVSHNMRAPVARILGLISLMEAESTPDERLQLMEYLKESTVGLDEIIHDLSQIIDLRRGSEMIMENVDLERIIQHNLADLTDELKSSHAQVNLSIEARTVIAVKGYIQSILYNLISNAIKYRDPARQLLLTISTSENNFSVIIEVADNGLGINVPDNRLHEIFHLYKRTHTHVQGKGLGLYLVKTQVEALHGHIDVESAPGKGSCFRVSLPKGINTTS
ncbi:MAG TPA: sensor histidine kinase [Chryseosolibacter sp.]